MRNPRPFVVIQNGTFLFVIHAYSARQARTLVAARLADTTGVRHRRAAQGFAAMIPDTKNGLPAMACVSAMQKCDQARP